ncbi:MAG: ATP-binding cassette domain-containing protein [Pseudomonadota bacterium]
MHAILKGGASAPPLAQELVRLCKVDKSYPAGMAAVHALHGVDIGVAPGEIVAICGPSGSGKTSLLKLIGLLEQPSAGSVIVGKSAVATLDEAARASLRAQLTGFVFQAFSLVPVMTAQENVTLPLLLRQPLRGAAWRAAQAQAGGLLAQLGLGTLGATYPARLTPSQRQRVAIARALITAPKLVVADEPNARQDSACQRLVMNLFLRYQGEHGTAFVISSRDQRQLPYASRTLQLHEGHLQAAPATPAQRMPWSRP